MNKSIHIDQALKRILWNNVRPGTAIEEISEDTDIMNDLALDSLAIVNLFVDLEEEFQISIQPADLERPILNRYRNLKEYVMEKMNDGS